MNKCKIRLSVVQLNTILNHGCSTEYGMLEITISLHSKFQPQCYMYVDISEQAELEYEDWKAKFDAQNTKHEVLKVSMTESYFKQNNW